MKNCAQQIVSKVGPAGVGPATKRIRAQIQFGYTFMIEIENSCEHNESRFKSYWYSWQIQG
jgi:hypothetical protein